MSNFYSLTNLSQTLNAIMLQHYHDINKKEDGSSSSLPPFMLEILNRISFDLATLMDNDYADPNAWKSIAAYAELANNLTTEQKNLQQQQQQEVSELTNETSKKYPTNKKED
tara:strand:+ start:465 stop:800 length:336 start_codon:yes stop_codon:yes gene_type:complete